MSGFTARPAEPPVVARGGQQACAAEYPGRDKGGVYCERPAGHDGGHLSRTRDCYWQAAQVPA
jgi:hypothetical protein